MCCVQSYVRVNQWVFWTAWGLAIAMILVLSCVEKARRSFPTNMILLAAFTCVQAFLVGTLTAFYNIEAVAIAFAVTAAAVVGITIFAINTKIDVTKWGTMLLVALIAFIVLLIIGMFWRTKLLYLIISGIACLLFSAYLVSATLWNEHGASILCCLTFDLAVVAPQLPVLLLSNIAGRHAFLGNCMHIPAWSLALLCMLHISVLFLTLCLRVLHVHRSRMCHET